MQSANRQKLILRVSRNTILGNLLLTAFKLAAGVLAGSVALLSDAVHSASDVLSTLIVIAGARLGGKAADDCHPYGHERMESVAALVLAGILCVTGLAIGCGGVLSLLGRGGRALAVPGLLALVAAAVSIVAKEGMYHYTAAAARRVGSGALQADAWHHRSDALSSMGSLIGVAGARLGLPLLDPLACVVISGFVVKAACDIFRDAVRKLTDRACPDDTVAALREAVLAVPGVLAVDTIRTRLFGERVYVDVEIAADPNASLRDSHETAERVHDAIESGFPQVKHCMVHVNPAREDLPAGSAAGRASLS